MRAVLAGRRLRIGALAVFTVVAMVPARAEIIDRVLAVVAGNVITLSDVGAARVLGFVRPAGGTDPTRSALDALIDRELVLVEVDRYAPPEPPPAAVDQGVAVVRARFPSDAAFRAALDLAGFDTSRLRGYVRQDLRIASYEDQRFAVAAPEEDDLVQYYRDHPARFTTGGALAPYGEVRDEVAAAIVADRRRALVDDWIAGLRRRADIVDLYLDKRSGPGR
jgi:hypothetical protein